MSNTSVAKTPQEGRHTVLSPVYKIKMCALKNILVLRTLYSPLIKYLLNKVYFNPFISSYTSFGVPGRVAQSVTCLATDVSLTSEPGVPSSIPAWSHTFEEIDHKIISTVILLPSAESFKKGCCQLQVKVCAQSTG